MVVELIPDDQNSSLVREFLARRWESAWVVSRGKFTDASSISRVIARENGNLAGLATFLIDRESGSCELVTIDAEQEGRGTGTKLMKLVEKAARENGAKRIWLITTNDNYEAAIFYIKNGYRLVSVHKDALDLSRKLKPQIPAIGKHNIPLQDEWEFEKYL